MAKSRYSKSKKGKSRRGKRSRHTKRYIGRRPHHTRRRIRRGGGHGGGHHGCPGGGVQLSTGGYASNKGLEWKFLNTTCGRF
jgi:hypothetical protein